MELPNNTAVADALGILHWLVSKRVAFDSSCFFGSCIR